MQAILDVQTDKFPTTATPVSSKTNAGQEPVSDARTVDVSKQRRWASRTMSGIAVLLLVFDAVAKLAMVAPVVEATTKIGYPVSSIVPVGLTLLASVIVHLIPRSATLGAILLTGYLGGAVATHVRIGDPLFSHILFPVYVGVLIWGGLYLRDRRIRGLLASSQDIPSGFGLSQSRGQPTSD